MDRQQGWHMDSTKEIGEYGTIDTLTIGSFDSMITSSITSPISVSIVDSFDLSNLKISSGVVGNGGIGASGSNANVQWTTGTNTSAIGQTFTIGPNTQSWGDKSTVGGLYTQNNSGKISLTGEKADIDINGKSMLQWMQKVEERLNILTPNPDMEKDWDDLRKLGERYRKLEKKCKQKAEMWNKLKSMPAPKVR
jgi:hypothetical protein